MQKKHTTFGNIILLLCATVWGLAFAFQRRAAGSINPIAFNGLRFTLATFVLLITLVVFELIDRKRGVKRTGWNKSTIIGGVLCGISLILASNLQQYGIESTSAGRASFITALYIVLVPVLGLLIGKKLGVLSRFAIPIALAGFWLMCTSDDGGLGIGDLLGLASTLFFAIQIQFIDIFGKDSDPIKITFVQFFTCALVSIPGMAIAGFPPTNTFTDFNNLINLLYVGIFSAGIGYTLQTVGQKYTEPSVASLIMSLESVVGLIGAVLILHEVHSNAEMAGCLLVFLAVILAQFSIPRKFLRFDKNSFALTASKKQWFYDDERLL